MFFLTINYNFVSFFFSYSITCSASLSHDQIEKLNLRRMLSNYRNVSAAKTAPILIGKNNENPQASTKAHHQNNNKEHPKNQPILPEVGQYVYDTKTGKKYVRGKLMGKVSSKSLYAHSHWLRMT